MNQIRHYIVDKFHAHRHSRKCRCNPNHRPSLAKKVRGVNTLVCEQVFSWFRNYAVTFNSLTPLRHQFMVLYYVKRHNDLVSRSQVEHLNKFAAAAERAAVVRKKPSIAYGCGSGGERGRRAGADRGARNSVLKKPARGVSPPGRA